MSILKPTFNETLQLLDNEYTYTMDMLKGETDVSGTYKIMNDIVNNWIENGV